MEIALYFAWLGFLNYFLLGAALPGIFVFFYGINVLGTDFPQIVSMILNSTFLFFCSSQYPSTLEKENTFSWLIA